MGSLTWFWSVVLFVLGIRELLGISTGRAAGAVILAVMIALLIHFMLAAFFFIAYSEINPLFSFCSGIIQTGYIRRPGIFPLAVTGVFDDGSQALAYRILLSKFVNGGYV